MKSCIHSKQIQYMEIQYMHASAIMFHKQRPQPVLSYRQCATDCAYKCTCLLFQKVVPQC